MKRLVILIGCVVLPFLSRVSVAADPDLIIPVWPRMAPGEKGDIGPEAEVPRNDPIKTTRITSISQPTLQLWRPKPEKDCGTTVIICPGGGYNYVVVDKEGSEVAAWLNSLGATGAVLKYRVPVRKDRPKHEAPLQDAQRAVSLLRHRAKELQLNGARIGILGLSAGGQVAALCSTHFEKLTYPLIDDADRAGSRPDFSMLLYPAYLADKETGQLAADVPVSSKTPSAFLMMTQDDGLGVESAVAYYLALKRAKVSAEMHLYPTGGHGYGMRLEPVHTAASWPARAEDWLRTGGWLTRP